MEKENFKHQSFHVKIIEKNADNSNNIQKYTDGSKIEAGVEAGIAKHEDNFEV